MFRALTAVLITIAQIPFMLIGIIANLAWEAICDGYAIAKKYQNDFEW